MIDGGGISRPHVFLPSQLGVSSARTLLLLHGTGADENDLIPLGRQLLPDANLISPRGLFIESGMNRFFERYPDGSFNESSVTEAVLALQSFLVSAAEHYGFDSASVLAAGFSNGANTAAALLLRHPETLTSAILFGSTRPFVNLAPQPDLSGKSIWLANGDQDSYAPLHKSLEWVEELSHWGAAVVFLRHSGGHQISAQHVQQISSQLA